MSPAGDVSHRSTLVLTLAWLMDIMSDPRGSGLDEIWCLFNNKSASDHEVFKKPFSRLVEEISVFGATCGVFHQPL